MVTHYEGLPSIRSPNLLNTWSFEIMTQMENVLFALLPMSFIGIPIVTKPVRAWFTARSSHPQSHMAIKPSGCVILISSMIFKFRIQTPEVVITWSRFAGMKFRPAQPGQISAYDYMGKSNFIPAIRDRISSWPIRIM